MQSAILELPGFVDEGSTGNLGYLLLAFPAATPLTFQLSTAPAGVLSVPATVTVQAGDSVAAFTVASAQDSLVNFSRTVQLSATAAGVEVESANVTVLDDEIVIPTLEITPTVNEGAPSDSAQGTLHLDRTADEPLTFTLFATPAGKLSLPSQVTVPAGQSAATFTFGPMDDDIIDG